RSPDLDLPRARKACLEEVAIACDQRALVAECGFLLAELAGGAADFRREPRPSRELRDTRGLRPRGAGERNVEIMQRAVDVGEDRRELAAATLIACVETRRLH